MCPVLMTAVQEGDSDEARARGGLRVGLAPMASHYQNDITLIADYQEERDPAGLPGDPG